MKFTGLVEEANRAFVPFKVTIEIDDVAEARLLYHVMNHGRLRSAMFNDGKYTPIDCPAGITAECFQGDDTELREAILKRIPR